MSYRFSDRRRGGSGVLLLVVAAIALLLAVLAIFTDIFEKKEPAGTPGTTVIQPGGNDPAAQPDATPDGGMDKDAEGNGPQSGEDGNRTTVTTTRPASSSVITASGTPYTSNGIYVVGNAGYEVYDYIGSLTEKYQEIVNGVAKSLDGVSDVYVLPVPLSSGITLPDALYDDIPGSDQKQAEADILAGMGDTVKTVPLHDALMAHRTEYIYFRTDHHWTALGAYYAYREFCGAKGITPYELREHEVVQYDGFLGTFYNDAGKPAAMAATPDVVNAYYPLSDDTNLEFLDAASQKTYTGAVIWDESDAAASLKYSTFITGDNPYTVIENREITDGSSCIVVKESFGNAFVPFLVDHYQTIYVIDYRYYAGSVTALAREKAVDDVLFVNALTAIRGSYQMGKLYGVK